MGLDSVELVIAFEEAFGFAIEDAVAEKMRTPRDVIDFVEKYRGEGTKKLCLTRRAFHRIRERLMTVGIARSAVRPDVALAQLFPETTRRSLWPKARGEVSLSQWPNLERSQSLQNAIFVTTILLASMMFVTVLARNSGRQISTAILSASGTAILSAYFLLKITEGQRRQFPKCSPCAISPIVRQLADQAAFSAKARNSPAIKSRRP